MKAEILGADFEYLYLKVREKESRLYSDDSLAALPWVPKTHLHFREWMIRKMSFEKFSSYLQQKNKPLHILDLGCGNGWMSNKMSEINQSHVTGVDLNRFEIEQAKRVFQNNQRLTFLAGDLLSDHLFQTEKFDIIVLASSIQYFPDLHKLIKYLLGLLNSNGEIHIVDSPFYTEKNIVEAKETSRLYYKKLDCLEMAECYHHHLWKELSGFHFSILNRSLSSRFFLKFFRTKRNYFPWVVIHQF